MCSKRTDTLKTDFNLFFTITKWANTSREWRKRRGKHEIATEPEFQLNWKLQFGLEHDIQAYKCN